MENDAIRRGIADYGIEISNIRYFLKEKRTMSQWQDWLWKRVPKLSGKTTKIGPSTMRLGRWGTDSMSKDTSVLYTDLLTYLCKIGDVKRVRYTHTTTYEWVAPT